MSKEADKMAKVTRKMEIGLQRFDEIHEDLDSMIDNKNRSFFLNELDGFDIDPRIVDIGVERNPDGAYRDPRVTRHINDGRAFPLPAEMMRVLSLRASSQ